MRFAVIGGDARQAMLWGLLRKDGHTVTAFGLEKAGIQCGTLAEASGAECVILPLPAEKGDGRINTPLSGEILTVEQVFSNLTAGQRVFAGKIGPSFSEAARRAGVTVHDYFRREDFTVLNAAATAEGAVQLIMENTPRTVAGARCLVVGFGRIGKLLCRRLWALGADVTATARKPSDLAWIAACGYKSAETSSAELTGYDVIVNTVPAMLLDEARLRTAGSQCFCLDLASPPYGIDLEAAGRLGITAVRGSGLPGRAAPLSAAGYVRDTVYNILNERESFK